MDAPKPKKENVFIAKSLEVCTAITHDGEKFHGDEVVACAILSMVMPKVMLIRTHDPKIINAKKDDINTVIFDVGGMYEPDKNLFDHHQESFYRFRKGKDGPGGLNGQKYAAAGLLWEHYGEDIVRKSYGCPEKYAKAVAERVDKMMIEGIDARDYAEEPNLSSLSISGAISIMNPIKNSSERPDERFVEATKLAKKILHRVILNAIQSEEGQQQVREILYGIQDDKTEVLVLPEDVPGWNNVIVNCDKNVARRLKFVVYKSKESENEYDVEAIAESTTSNSYEKIPYRMKFPEEWRGEKGYRLRRLTGLESVGYCHKNGHIASTRTEEDAIALAKLAIEISRKRVRKLISELPPSTEILVMSKEVSGWKSIIAGLDDEVAKNLKIGVYKCSSAKFGDEYVAEAIPRSYFADCYEGKEPFRVLFPEKWRGQGEERLRVMTDVKTVIHCKWNGQKIFADTEKDAVSLAEKAINWKGR